MIDIASLPDKEQLMVGDKSSRLYDTTNTGSTVMTPRGKPVARFDDEDIINLKKRGSHLPESAKISDDDSANLIGP